MRQINVWHNENTIGVLILFLLLIISPKIKPLRGKSVIECERKLENVFEEKG